MLQRTGSFKDGKLSVARPRPSSPDRQPEPQTPSQGTIKQWLAMAAALSKEALSKAIRK